jgi:tetratricopeptide (TPR) repeat protein
MKEQYMKKVLVTFVLALTTAAMAQGTTQQPTTQPSQPGQTDQTQANTPASQKVIKDPAEYNAYITALNTQDPTAKAAAMEAFVQQYPQSVVKIDALEQAMAAYQQAGNQQKVEATAKRILELNPNNIRALAIITFINRAQATGGNSAALQEVCNDSQKGTQALPSWEKPAEMNDADFAKLKNQMAEIFDGAAGFCALQNKNYPVARENYLKSVQVDPNNMQDTFQLAVADLEMNPMDLNGLWYCGKAIHLAQAQNNAAAIPNINNYCQAKYRKYSGKNDGWDQIVAAAATQPAPPANFAQSIPKAPTPPELAVQAVQQNDPGTLSFSDWEFILGFRDVSPANKEAADKVWAAIQAKEKNGEAKLRIPVKVISATKESIDAAITDENQAANKADLHVVMEKPMLRPPAPNTTIDVIGVITNYQPNPFMFTMEKGELPAAKKTPPATHHPTARRKKK